jgi:hypothetical protein
MRYGVVEGEPGVFPAPVAKVMRAIGGFFGRRKPDAASAPPPDGSDGSPGAPGDTPSFSDLDPKPPADRG